MPGMSASAPLPLAGVRVMEFCQVAAGPFCGMLFSDMGAEVIRIDRKHAGESGLPVARKLEVMFPARRSVAMDLKQPAAVEAVRRMAAEADVLIEGFRPGVMERLGLKVARLIRTAYGPFQLGQLTEGQVEEIPARLWREKLGIGRKKRADRFASDRI